MHITTPKRPSTTLIYRHLTPLLSVVYLCTIIDFDNTFKGKKVIMLKYFNGQ